MLTQELIKISRRFIGRAKFTSKDLGYFSYASGSWGGFSNDLRETLTYGELLKHEFYPILINYG